MVAIRKIIFGAIIYFTLINAAFSQDINFSKLLYDDSSSMEIVNNLIEIAWENYPKNKVFQHLLNFAEEKKYQEAWSWLNTFNVTWQYNPMYEKPDEVFSVIPRFGLGLVVNVGHIFLTPSRVLQAKEEVKIAEANLHTQKNYIKAEVTRRYFNYIENLELLKVHSQSMEDSDLVMKLVKNRFKEGEVNIEDYTRALSLYNSSRENIAKTKGKVMNAKYSLEETLGVKLDQAL